MKIRNARCWTFANIFLVRRSSLFTYVIPGICSLLVGVSQNDWMAAPIIPSFILGWFIGTERWRRVISVAWLVLFWKVEWMFVAALVAALLTMGIDAFRVDLKRQLEKEALEEEEDAGCVG